MVAVPQYIVRTRNLDGTGTFDAPHRNLQYSFVLNGGGTANWTMPLQETGVTRANFEPWKREVIILRDGATVWGGFVSNANAHVGEGGEEVRVQAVGWFEKLHRRVIDVDKIYVDVEQFDIVWDLINYTQGKTDGGIGITRDAGETPSGVTRRARFRWWERRFIAPVIEEWAALNNGFDWEITPTKVWKVYFPKKGGASGQTFTLGGNVTGMAQELRGDDLATEIHAIGAGDRNRTCIAVVNDATAQAAYKRLEGVADFVDIKHFDVLERKGNRELAHRKQARDMPQLAVVTDAPAWGSYEVGETASVVANYGFLQINGTYRIIAIVNQLTEAGSEVVTVHFDSVVAP